MPAYVGIDPDLEFIDGFQHYDYATAGQKYQGPGGGYTVLPTAGRFGGKALVNGSSANPFITFKSNPDEIYVGMAMKLTDAWPIPERYVFALRDNSTVQCGLVYRFDGRLDVRRGDGTVLGLTDYAGHANSWDYYEFYLRVHNSAGAFEVRVNETTVLAVTGLNTRASNNNYATNLFLGSVASPESRYLNDLYVHFGHFLGDVRIERIVPNATGPDQAWTPSTGVTHWNLLEEIPPNGDTDYVYTETLNAKESNEMEDVTLVGTCLGIQMLHSSRKIEANVRKLKHLLVDGGGAEYLGREDSLGNSYVYYKECLELSPFTGLAFTEAEINAFKYGVKLSL